MQIYLYIYEINKTFENCFREMVICVGITESKTFTDRNYDIFHKWIYFQRNCFKFPSNYDICKESEISMKEIRVLEFG